MGYLMNKLRLLWERQGFPPIKLKRSRFSPKLLGGEIGLGNFLGSGQQGIPPRRRE